MISAKFLWGNVFIGGKLQIDAKNSNFEIFESALYLKSVSMPLILISPFIPKQLCMTSCFKILECPVRRE